MQFWTQEKCFTNPRDIISNLNEEPTGKSAKTELPWTEASKL